jgi:two-component system NarL family sensor kinase
VGATAGVATWSGAGATVGLVAASAVLAVTNGDPVPALTYTPLALSFGIVGSAVLAGRHRHPVGVLFAATGVVVAFLTATEELAVAGLARGWSREAVSASAWLAVWPIELTVGLVVAAFLVFPDGRLPSRRWRPVLLATAVTTAAGSAMAALTPVNFDPDDWQVPAPVSLLPAHIVSPAFAAYRFASLVLLVLAALSLVLRWRCGGAETRRQVAWVAAAAVATVSAVVLTLPLGVAPSTATRLLLPCIPLAAGVAILQRRLYEVDRAAPRTVVYGTVSALLTAAFVLAVLSAGRLAGTPLGAASLMAAVLLTADPLRRRLQRRLDVLLLGDPDLPALARRLAACQPQEPDDLLRQLAGQLRSQLGRAYVAIEPADVTSWSSRAHAGTATGPLERIPLVHQGEGIGTMVLARSPLRWARRAQSHAVSQVLPYVALVVAAARTTAERDMARRELVSTREEERARVRRLLHDAAGSLSGVGLQLDVAADAAQPARVGYLLRMREEVTDVARTVRGLAYEMGPSALGDASLVEALSRTVAVLPASPERPWQVEVRGTDGPAPLPAAVEIAAFRIAVEAVRNAYRHGEGRRCTVEVDVDTELRLMVSDDGRGLPEPWHPGIGVAGMRERAEELGGTLRLSVPPHGGTLVELRLPLQREPQ